MYNDVVLILLCNRKQVRLWYIWSDREGVRGFPF